MEILQKKQGRTTILKIFWSFLEAYLLIIVENFHIGTVNIELASLTKSIKTNITPH